MDLPTSSEVLSAIDAFLSRHGMAPSRFGAEATGDQNLVTALRGGASPRLDRLHRIRDYMARKDREAGFVEHISDDTVANAATSPGKKLNVTGSLPHEVGSHLPELFVPADSSIIRALP